jgi:[ribosomal protein S18]-alanine N-acetyltransferase
MAPEAAASQLWIVRDFQPADLAGLVEIARASVEAAQWSRESYLSIAGTPGSFLLVAGSDDCVSGFLAARSASDEAEILNIAVSPTARRLGIGSALVAAALDRFGEQHLASVFLEVRESNTPAIALYGKLGFSVSSRRKGYYQGPLEDAVCMVKKLTASTN